MSILEKFSVWLWNRAFVKKTEQQRIPRAKNTDAIKSALLIYDADGDQHSRKYLEAWLEDQGIRTDLLGITGAGLQKSQPAKAGLMYRNDFHFWYEAKSSAIPDIIRASHDVLICMADIHGRKADLLAAMANSPYKAGPDREFNRPAYDLLFKFRPHTTDLRERALSIIKIFNEIKYEKV